MIVFTMPSYRIISTAMARPPIDIEAASAREAFHSAARDGILAAELADSGRYALSVRQLGGPNEYWIATGSCAKSPDGADPRQDKVFALLWLHSTEQ